MNNQTELFQRLIANVDNESVRMEIANTLPELALLSERNVYKFKELLDLSDITSKRLTTFSSAHGSESAAKALNKIQ